jgi:hypothetical protein
LRDQRAVRAEQHDTVGDQQGLVDIMRHEHRSRVRIPHHLDEQALHVGARDFVERAERFVQQQRARLAREAAGKRRALRHAARQLAWHISACMCQADFVQRRRDALAPFAARKRRLFREAEAKAHVTFNRQPRQQARILECQCDIGTGPRERFSVDEHLAGSGLEQPGKNAQQGRFARSARTQHRDEFACLDAQIELTQHGSPAITQRDAAHLR